MHFDQFIETFSVRYQLDLHLQRFLKENLQRAKVAPNQVLLRAGEVPNRIYFLAEGLVRGYYTDKANGIQVTSWFCHWPDLLGNIQHFVLRKRLEETIHTPVASILYFLPQEVVYGLLQNSANLGSLYNKFLRNYLSLIHKRSYCRDALRNEEKMRRFEEIMPGLIHSLNQNHVASYLGMSRGRLNRLLHTK